MNPKSQEQHIFEQVSIALFLANKRDWFPVLNKITSKVLELLQDEDMRAVILKEVDVGANFTDMKKELYVTHDENKKYLSGPFGGIVISESKAKVITLEDALNDMESKLKDENATVIDIMPILSVVNFRILQKITPEAYKKAGDSFSEYLKAVQAEKSKVNSKKAEEKDIQPTTVFGTEISKSYMNAIAASESAISLSKKMTVLEHRTSWLRFNVNREIGAELPIIGEFIKHGLPLIAGPSTHIISLLTAVKSLQSLLPFELSDDEFAVLSVAYCVYLTVAGYHTGNEVLFSAAKCLGQEYNFNDFLANFPQEITERAEFKALLESINKTQKNIVSSLANSHSFFCEAPKEPREASTHSPSVSP